MKTETYKITLLPIISIFIISLIFTYSDKFILESYHKKIIHEFTKSYKKEQYKKIKDDVSRLENTISYTKKIYAGDNKYIEEKALERLKFIDMTDSPYVFILKVLNIDGGKNFAKILFYNNRPQMIGKIIPDDRKKFLKNVIKDLKKQGYSYVTYKHTKQDNKNLSKKLTYFYLDKELNWIITSSVYLDEVDSVIRQKDIYLESQVKKLINRSIQSIIFFTITVGLISFFISRKISNKIKTASDGLEIQRIKAENAAKELEIMATKDFLTGLYNRRYFIEFADKAVSLARRQGSSLSCLMIDIDRFKDINDTNGHSTGDTVLKSLSEILQTMIRSCDIVARYGGEEFIVFLQNTNISNAQMTAEKIRQTVKNQKLKSNGNDINYTVSIGVSQFDVNIDKSLDTIINRADEALYEAKATGRNKVVAKKEISDDK